MRERFVRRVRDRTGEAAGGAKERAEDLEAMTRLIESGAVTPVIDRTHALVDAPDAISYLAEGHAADRTAPASGQAMPSAEDAKEIAPSLPVPEMPALTVPVSTPANAALTAPLNTAQKTSAPV